jgi:hypothetical protein
VDDGQHGDALAADVALILAEHGDGCIVDLNGSFYAVSPVAAAMLRDTFADGRAVAIASNAARYGVEETRIAADLDSLLIDLRERGLLRSTPARRRSGFRRVLAHAIAGMAQRALRLARSERARARIALTAARASFLISGWNVTVKAWCRRPHEAPMEPSPVTRAQAIDDAVRSVAARHMMNVDCKERALAGFALARFAGLPATLVVGVDFYPLAGHSWCETGDAVIGDEESHCRRFTPAFRLS